MAVDMEWINSSPIFHHGENSLNGRSLTTETKSLFWLAILHPFVLLLQFYPDPAELALQALLDISG